MSLSPLIATDAYTESDAPVILKPASEWSTILRRLVPVGPDRHVFYRKKSTLPVHIIGPDETIELSRGIAVCSGCPLEVQVGACGCRAIFDFHEAWHDVHYGSPHVHWHVIVHYAAGHYTATRSCSVQFSGTVVSVKVVPGRALHGAYAYGAGALARVQPPANGQVWAASLLPGVSLVAPFCPRRGYICTLCNRTFETLSLYHTHCTGSSTLPVYRCINANNRSFCTTSQYPRPVNAVLERYSVCQFTACKLVQLLACVKRTRANRKQRPDSHSASMKLQINPFV